MIAFIPRRWDSSSGCAPSFAQTSVFCAGCGELPQGRRRLGGKKKMHLSCGMRLGVVQADEEPRQAATFYTSDRSPIPTF